MTSSKTFNRILAVGAAILLSLGGTATPAQAAQYTITFSEDWVTLTNGAAPASITTGNDGSFTVPDDTGHMMNSNAANGYRFMGWTTSSYYSYSTSSPTFYYPGDVVTATGNMALNALWGWVPTNFAMSTATRLTFGAGSATALDGDGSWPLASDYTVTVDGTANPVASVIGTQLTLTNPVARNADVRVAYTMDRTRRLGQGAYNIPLPSFSNVQASTASLPLPSAITNGSSFGSSATDRNFSFNVNFSGSFNWVIKLATSPAPASASDLMAGAYGTGVVANATTPITFDRNNGNPYFNTIGTLTASTSYIAYVAANDGTSDLATMLQIPFTTGAPTRTLTLDLHSGTFTQPTTYNNLQDGTSYVIDNLVTGYRPSRNGYTFSGWSLTDGGAIITSVTMNGDKTVHAVWTVQQNQGGGPGAPITVVTAPSYSISGSTATAFDGTWSAAGTISRFWILCDNAHVTSSANPPRDCTPLALTQNGSDERGTTLTLATNVWQGFSGHRTQVALADKFLALYVNISNGRGSYVTATTAVSAQPAQPDNETQPPVLRPSDALKALKPLPPQVKAIAPALPALNKPIVDLGGKLSLTAGNFSGLVSASISGKPLDLTVGSNGGLTITVPNGKAGTSADLLLNFTTGTVILQDAIKYVAPLVVSKVPERSVAIKAGSTKLSPATADQVRQAAFANMSNNSVSCVAYASSNTAAAKAAALATAKQVCALATKANPGLTAAPITVVVNKAKARTSAVGIKVYKK